ncbi:unnamed protein product [Adineta steineri]|uniref:SCP domain-containing protein n=1 Tax=Adineta steineri TaxID=433720 RepID=A0A813SDN5_9BILA|nr:unnamed protein product [Adineta steineri]CAF0793929.1 unnamed protein product [Adineta steineri]
MAATNEELSDSSVTDDDDNEEMLMKEEIANILSLDGNEHKDDIVNSILYDGRQTLVEYREDIIPKIYKETMDNNNSPLMLSLKQHFEKTLQARFSEDSPWFVTFLREYKEGENHDLYDRVMSRIVDGGDCTKNFAMLSIPLQLLFEGLDDECMKEGDVFDHLWSTITNDGLQSIKKFSDYIIKSVMDEQLKSGSTLFRAVREYYRDEVVSSLNQCNITNKRNIYESALDDVAEHGWLGDVKSIKDDITPRAHRMLLEELRSFHEKAQPPADDKSKAMEDNSGQKTTSDSKDTSSEKAKGNEEQKTLFHGMDATEKEIFMLINKHRQHHGLPSLEPSVNLAYVAHTHAVDIIENNPDVAGGNMHSWSNKGKWKAVRYTPDHRQGQLMWSKPTEISNYKFNGFEISFGHLHPLRKTSSVTPTEAVNSWKSSSGHNAVMIQQGIWQHPPMKAMGVGVYKGYACTWFGQEKDTFPTPS